MKPAVIMRRLAWRQQDAIASTQRTVSIVFVERSSQLAYLRGRMLLLICRCDLVRHLTGWDNMGHREDSVGVTLALDNDTRATGNAVVKHDGHLLSLDAQYRL
jgi:hypothetical protein